MTEGLASGDHGLGEPITKVVLALDLEAKPQKFSEPVLGAGRQIRQRDALALEDLPPRSSPAKTDVGIPSVERRGEVVEAAERQLPVVGNAVRVRPEILAGRLESEMVSEEVSDAQAREQEVVLVRVAGTVDLFELADEAVSNMGADVGLARERRRGIDAVSHLGGLRQRGPRGKQQKPDYPEKN